MVIQVHILEDRVELEEYIPSAKPMCRFYDPLPVNLEMKEKLESALSKVKFTMQSTGLCS